MSKEFTITIDCGKHVLADLLALALERRAEIKHIKRNDFSPEVLTEIENLFSDEADQPQLGRSTGTPQNRTPTYKQQITAWEVYKILTEAFTPPREFTVGIALAFVNEQRPLVTQGSVSGHVSRFKKAGLVRVANPGEHGARYVLTRPVSKVQFDQRMEAVRQTV